MRYCPYWPAQIPTDRDKVQNYVANRSKFVKKGRGVAFRTAVQHIDDFISDPFKFRSHIYIEPTEQVLQTERDIENSLGIKHEVIDVPDDDNITMNVSTLENVPWL